MDDRIDVNIDGGLDVSLPRMVPVRQTFDARKIEDITGAVKAQFKRSEIASTIQSGRTIAIGAGSRGVANVAETVRALVAEVKALGGKPFVFPAMGSHGGATAEGQTGVLATYGITEATVGAPVRATMETATLGELPDGTRIYQDKFANEADGVILVNRIKPHTNFRAPIESGIVKMMTIGMGKIRGATELHTHGMDRFPELLPKAAEFILGKIPFLFGVGLVENGYDETAILEAIPAAALFARETELQAEAKRLMGRLYFDRIDVLVIEEIGKNISGSGFDPNITGRNARGIEWDMKPECQKIVLLDLTGETHGNATGLGVADIITMKLFRKIDYGFTYANVITSTNLDSAAIPMIMNTPKEAIQLAAKTVPRVKPQDIRIVCIRDTLTLGQILVSETMMDEVRAHPQMEAIGAPTAFAFDEKGELLAA